MQSLIYLFKVAMYPFHSIQRFVAVFLSFVAIFVGLTLWLTSARENMRQYSCSMNQRQLWLAMQQYLQDSDGKFPRTTFGGPKVAGKGLLYTPIAKYKGQPVGWADALIPYFYSESMLMCPSEGNTITTPAKTHYTDYYMNSNLSEKYRLQLLRPESTIVFADGGGTDISDATYARSSIPAAWINDPNSPANRHCNAANYVMADGSLEWLKPNQVMTFGDRKSSFAVR